ncbi:MAG: hypothetical protein JEZ09_18095 [Salinivirgaceae bacterium]|nr:hypothetical protein [Salinivirgaceae bacterium]
MRTIEILIALALVYAILSILVSVLVEWRSGRKKLRGTMLRQVIYQMLDDPLNQNYGYLLTKHPLIDSMKNKEDNRPFQYLESGLFADALIDIICDHSDTGIPVVATANTGVNDTSVQVPDVVKLFENGLLNMKPSPFQKSLQGMFAKSDHKYENLKKSIEVWYNSGMDRATGWYKRKLGKISLIWGFVVAITLNADSIHMFKVISMDSNLRNNLNIMAEGVASNYILLDSVQKFDMEQQLNLIVSQQVAKLNVTDSSRFEIQVGKAISQNLNQYDSVNQLRISQINQIMDVTAQLGLPIGWNKNEAPLSWDKQDIARWFMRGKEEKILRKTKNRYDEYLQQRNENPNFGSLFLWLLGIVITGVMLSYGSPFWFQILVKLVNIRKSGLKPKTVKNE